MCQNLKDRLSEHKYAVRIQMNDCLMATHFKEVYNSKDISLRIESFQITKTFKIATKNVK